MDTAAESATAVQKPNLVRSTLIVMGALAAAKVISLLQTVIVAQQFGIGRDWDTYTTADTISGFIATLISGGALGHAFIPVFGGLLARGETQNAWKVASRVLNTLLLFMLLVCAVVFIFAPQVARLQAPGFDEAGIAQTAGLLRVLLVSTMLLSLSGIVMGVLHSHNHFLMPALAPVVLDVGILFGVFFFVPSFGIYGMVYGTVLGAAGYLGIQIPALLRYKPRWWAALGLSDPTLWRVYRLLLPRIAGMALGLFHLQLGINIASRMGDSGVSAFGWGWRLMQIPESLIGTAMATVIFPTLAALSAVNDEKGKRDSMSGSLAFILIATIPAAVGMVLVGQPAISLLEGRAFDAQATALVYSAVSLFSLGLIVHSLLEVVARSFYADEDTVTPLWAALAGVVVNFGVAITLTGLGLDFFRPDAPPIDPGRVGYLSLANSLGTGFQLLVLLWILRGRWKGINEHRLWRVTWKASVASAAMGAAVLAVDALWRAVLPGGFALTLARVGVEVVLGAAVFTGAALLLRLDEVRLALDAVRARLTRRAQEPAA